MPALPPNSLIVVTGISGYIGSHTGLVILKEGHRVRGTVRSMTRANTLKAAYEKQGIPAAELEKRLEFAIVDNLQSEEQFTNAFKDVDGVIHPALDLDFGDPKIIDKAVDGMLAVLRAAKKYPSIKRVVFTSSMASVIMPPMLKDKVLTTEDWNYEAVDIVEKKLPVDHDPLLKAAAPFLPYSVAKVKCEKVAWEFVKETSFDFVVIIPSANMGPVLHEGAMAAHWIAGPLKNDTSASRQLPNQWFVDVRDTARLHLLALTTPSMGGKRFWACAQPFGWNEIFDIYRRNFPNAQVPEDFEGGQRYKQKVDNSASTELLGGWITLEQSLVDLAKSVGY